jgi:hypothetical protein
VDTYPVLLVAESSDQVRAADISPGVLSSDSCAALSPSRHAQSFSRSCSTTTT